MGRESGSVRPSEKEVSAEPIVFQLREAYIAKFNADPANDPVSLDAIEDHFHRVNTTLRAVERMRAEAEPGHLDALPKFAARAYRRHNRSVLDLVYAKHTFVNPALAKHYGMPAPAADESAGRVVAVLGEHGAERQIGLGFVAPRGGRANGFEGVQAYIREHRQNDFLDNLCRKLLAYSLGRSLVLSDEPTVERMLSILAANGYRFAPLVETIVTSTQFINKRSTDLKEQKSD